MYEIHAESSILKYPGGKNEIVITAWGKGALGSQCLFRPFFFVSISLETREQCSPNALALMVLAAVYVLPKMALGKTGKQKRSPRHLPPSLLAALVSGWMSFLDVSVHTTVVRPN